MGKNLIQQARGKGNTRYRSPSFRFKSDCKIRYSKDAVINGKIIDLVKCQGHSAPLMKIKYDDELVCMMFAPEGVRVGDAVAIGLDAKPEPGNILPLRSIPDGALIYNIESQPGDGGKFCRASGITARLLAKRGNYATIMLPSKRERKFHINCRACIGTIAGAGRKEKPFLKAGKMHYKKKAKNKLYPRTGACKMNAVDHPFGNKRSSRKAKQKAVGHFAQPGAKVGKLWPKRTGRRN